MHWHGLIDGLIDEDIVIEVLFILLVLIDRLIIDWINDHVVLRATTSST